jgi:hypothetical protein
MAEEEQVEEFEPEQGLKAKATKDLQVKNLIMVGRNSLRRRFTNTSKKYK